MGEGFQLALEGTAIEGLRASLPAIHVIPNKPMKSGQRGRLIIDYIVSELRFPYDSEGEQYKLRQHMLEATNVEFVEPEDG